MRSIYHGRDNKDYISYKRINTSEAQWQYNWNAEYYFTSPGRKVNNRLI